MDKTISITIKELNNLVQTACIDGGDAGGVYGPFDDTCRILYSIMKNNGIDLNEEFGEFILCDEKYTHIPYIRSNPKTYSDGEG